MDLDPKTTWTRFRGNDFSNVSNSASAISAAQEVDSEQKSSDLVIREEDPLELISQQSNHKIIKSNVKSCLKNSKIDAKREQNYDQESFESQTERTMKQVRFSSNSMLFNTQKIQSQVVGGGLKDVVMFDDEDGDLVQHQDSFKLRGSKQNNYSQISQQRSKEQLNLRHDGMSASSSSSFMTTSQYKNNKMSQIFSLYVSQLSHSNKNMQKDGENQRSPNYNSVRNTFDPETKVDTV